MTDRRYPRRTILRTTGTVLGGTSLSGLTSAQTGRRFRRQSAGDTTRFIVDTRDGLDQDITDTDLEVIHSLEQIDLLAVRGSESDVRRLSAPYVQDIEITRSRSATQTVPRQIAENESELETLYPFQWDKREMDIPAVHELTEGAGTRVAVIDSGVQADHPDLARAVDTERSRNLTDDGYSAGAAYGGAMPAHGTGVAGVIAADPSAGGLVGTAPETEIIDCRVFPVNGGASTGDYLAAIVYSADIGCDIANLSLGLGIGADDRQRIVNRFDTARVAQYADEAGMLLTVAAGNNAIDLRRFPNITFLNRRNVIVVSATGPIGFAWPSDEPDGVADLEDTMELESPVTEPAPYSNYGEGIINVSAPGGNYDSVARRDNVPGWHRDMLPHCTTDVQRDETGEFQFSNRYDWNRGTSLAAPQVAGVAALVKSVDPSLTPAEIRRTIEEAAVDVRGNDTDPFHGSGFLDPVAAVEAVRE